MGVSFTLIGSRLGGWETLESYQIHYRSRDGTFFSTNDFDAMDDTAAIERWRRLTVLRIQFEIWHGERLVYRNRSTPASPPPEAAKE
jgi:hypothetical protein